MTYLQAVWVTLENINQTSILILSSGSGIYFFDLLGQTQIFNYEFKPHEGNQFRALAAFKNYIFAGKYACKNDYFSNFYSSNQLFKGSRLIASICDQFFVD